VLVLDAIAFRHKAGDTTYRFDMEVEAGTIAGLTGPSGSGKSTLLDLVAGFLAPEAGDITLDGTSLLPLLPERRPVSTLFQANNLFDHLSVAANVALGVPKPAASPAAIENALAQMGIGGLGQRRAATLSGGQKQRVALARTLLRDKPVLLLDEPFTGIDAEAVAPIRDLISQLVKSRGWHGILVSHDEGDIAALAQRHYRLEDGHTLRVR